MHERLGSQVRQAKPLSSSLFRYMMAVFWSLCLGLGIAWIVGDVSHLNEDAERSEREFVEDRKKEVRDMISHLVDHINFNIDAAEAEQEAELKRRVDQVVDMTRHLYETNRDELSRDEMVTMVRESLRPLGRSTRSSYYFVFDVDGTVILNASRPDWEGRNFLDSRNDEGSDVTRRVLDVALERTEGLLSYEWTRAGSDRDDSRKKSYVKLFEPLGLVIGTGQYDVDFIADRQEPLLEWIRNFRFGEDGYVFVNTYDGIAVVIQSDKYEPGDNNWELTDPNGLKILQEQRRAVSNPEGDFIHYTWQEPWSETPVRKVSFIRGVERWRWMVGAGVNLDAVESILEQRRETMKKIVLRVVVQVMVAFLAAFLLAMFFARRLSGRIGGQLAITGRHFQEAVAGGSEIDPEELDYIEFRGFAGSMNEMIAERRRNEKELMTARNLESIGVLAGGIAHDFNNLLMAILGNISMAREDLTDGDPADATLEQAENVTLRARDLTQQLLAFAKGGAPVRSLENLSAILAESAEFSLRGSNVTLELDLEEGLRHAEVDAGQFSQVVGNLTINANQAMPRGGTLFVWARNRDLQEDNELSLPAGPYVAIEFRDTGEGIAEEDLSRVFDPYFTTKEGGSGLGLASVYAIIRNHGGAIRVESSAGRGTTFRLWIPARIDVRRTAEAPTENPKEFRARVLVMDDDPLVIQVCGQMLKKLGCEVDYASDGAEALDIYERELAQRRCFDLVIMDLTIRGGMGGEEAIRELLNLDPQARAIVSSGYSNNPVMAGFRQYGFVAMMRKPYNLGELQRVLAEVLPEN